MSRLRVFIIDDEPLARDRVRALLADEPAVELAGEFGNGPEAIAAIARHEPEIVFIDVEMPGCNGLEVVKALPAQTRPAVLFVTAHEQFAIEAFAVQAVDYLLKPFDSDRFQVALKRAIEHVRTRRSPEALKAGANDATGTAAKQERLAVKVDGRVVFVRPEEIRWIEAADNYVILHVANRRLMVRETMSAIEERLSGCGFARVNRSAIVNIEEVQELHPTFHGDYTVHLRDGTELPLSRSLRGQLTRFTGGAGNASVQS